MKKFVSSLIVLFFIFSTAIPSISAGTFTLDLSVNKDSYSPGEKIEFTGTVLEDGKAAKGYKPSLQVIDPNGIVLYVSQWEDAEMSNDGSVTTTFTLDTDAITGEYRAKLKTMNQQVKEIKIQVGKSDGKSVTVLTDKAEYQKGQTVAISGKVMLNNAAVKTSPVTILVLKGTSQLKADQVDTNSTGEYRATYVLPTNAEEGTYTIKIKAINKEVQTNITVKQPQQGGGSAPVIPIPSLPSPQANDKEKVEKSDVDAQLNDTKSNKVEVTLTKKNAEVSKEVIAQLVSKNKSLVLTNESTSIDISPKVIKQLNDLSSQVVNVSLGKVEKSTVKAVTGQTVVSDIQDYTITVNNNKVTTFAEPITVTMKVTGVISDKRKAAAYYINEATNKLEYVGGKITGNTITFKTSHFSKYVVITNNKSFGDVSNSSYAKESIEVLASRSIIQGKSESTFAPEADVTRAEFAVLLSRALNLSKDNYKGTFSDVPTSLSWANSDIEAAFRAGIVKGSNGKFNPNDSITRQEMATMIIRAVEHQKKDLLTGVNGSLTFKDTGSISGYAKNYVALAVDLGIIKGVNNGTEFAPKENASRAQTAVMLYRVLEKLGEF
jgi:hypothetical protein